jgi:hypothetical protein
VQLNGEQGRWTALASSLCRAVKQMSAVAIGVRR